jgi:hypothetical protein
MTSTNDADPAPVHRLVGRMFVWLWEGSFAQFLWQDLTVLGRFFLFPVLFPLGTAVIVAILPLAGLFWVAARYRIIEAVENIFERACRVFFK